LHERSIKGSPWAVRRETHDQVIALVGLVLRRRLESQLLHENAFHLDADDKRLRVAWRATGDLRK
jgi:hypothetical protein